MNAHIATKPFVWIKAESGEGYLCPVESVKGRDSLSEDELRAHCFADSERPWND